MYTSISYSDVDSTMLNNESKQARNLYARNRSQEDVNDHFAIGLFGEYAFAQYFHLVDDWWQSVVRMHELELHDDGGYDFQGCIDGVPIKIDVKCHIFGSDWMIAGSVKRNSRAHIYVCTLLDPAHKQVFFAGWCPNTTLSACPANVAKDRLGCKINNLFPIDTLFARLSNVGVR